MAEIAVKVFDPGGFRFAQLVDDEQPTRQVVALLVKRLDLPRELSYELIAAATGRFLAENVALAGAGVRAGAELILQPVRDTLFKALLDKLYDEAKGYVKDRLWDEAKERLGKIFRLEPAHPDPQRLRDKIPERGAPAEWSKLPPLREPTPAADVPPVTLAAPAPVTLAAKPAAGSSLAGCLLVVLVIGGAAAVYYKPWRLLNHPQGPASQRPGGRGPGNVGQPQLGTGDVQVTLRWHNAADLDLHVVDPNGETIYYGHRDSKSGGKLDVDANSSADKVMAEPVENVFWPPRGAPRGEYQVWVHYFAERNQSGPTNYTVTVRLDGRAHQTVNGVIAPGAAKRQVLGFRY